MYGTRKAFKIYTPRVTLIFSFSKKNDFQDFLFGMNRFQLSIGAKTVNQNSLLENGNIFAGVLANH